MTFRPSSSSVSRWDGFGIRTSGEAVSHNQPRWPSIAIANRFVMRLAPRLCLGRKEVAEHREAAFGLLPSGFVLNDVPMLHENSTFDSKNVRGDPVDRSAKAGEPAVDNDEVTIRHDDAGLVLERR